MITLASPSGDAERIEVAFDFSYPLPETDLASNPLSSMASGNAMEPAEIGLLGRHLDGASLGKWFPVWMTPGVAADPEPDGFGDIANFPAAMFTASLDVPAGWQVFTGATTIERKEEGAPVRYREEAVGLRDLSIYAGRALSVA